MGLNNRVSSVRTVGRDAQVDERRYAPAPVVSERYRRSNNERLFEVDVSSVRAVTGPPEQRCREIRRCAAAYGKAKNVG